MKISLSAGVLAFLLGFAALSEAQTADNGGSASISAPDLSILLAAAQVRSDMAVGIANGTEDSDTALARLKQVTSPMGLQTDPDAEYGYAAIDVGRRLLAAQKAADAEKFFSAAETILAAVVGRTADTQAADKAQYLQQLALIRGNYLNSAAQAKADIEQAILLQPGNKLLQQQRAMLASEHANLFTGGAHQG